MEEKNEEDAFEDTFEYTLFLNSNIVGSHATEKEKHNDSDIGPRYVLLPTPFDLCRNPVTVVAHSTIVCD
jgi:hypothetical protein